MYKRQDCEGESIFPIALHGLVKDLTKTNISPQAIKKAIGELGLTNSNNITSKKHNRTGLKPIDAHALWELASMVELTDAVFFQVTYAKEMGITYRPKLIKSPSPTVDYNNPIFDRFQTPPDYILTQVKAKIQAEKKIAEEKAAEAKVAAEARAASIAKKDAAGEIHELYTIDDPANAAADAEDDTLTISLED